MVPFIVAAVAIVVAFIGFDILAVLFGVDTRDGFDR